MKESEILLPAKKDGTPDWELMNTYTITYAKNYLEGQIQQLKEILALLD